MTRLHRLVLVVVLLSCNSRSTALAWQGRKTTRRDAMRAAVGCLIVTLQPQDPAHALVRGAAELDLEYYLRDLVGSQNEQQGNVLPSTPPAMAPPRVLQPPLLPALLTDDLAAAASACVPVTTLVQTIQQRSGGNAADIAKDIAPTAAAIREKASRAFYTRAPWQTATCSDEYYFDLTAYALWRTAALLLPNYVDRDVFVRNMGRGLYRRMMADGLVTAVAMPRTTGKVTATMDTVLQVLNAFCQSNYCKTYRLGPDELVDISPSKNNKNKKKQQDVPPAEPVVDELDDQALASGATVDLLVRILEPATLGAALQITGEQSRFAPDFVGPTLAAVWQDFGLSCTWETFFVDPVYRPNPKDYFPTEQLLQFTLQLS